MTTLEEQLRHPKNSLIGKRFMLYFCEHCKKENLFTELATGSCYNCGWSRNNQSPETNKKPSNVSRS